MQSLRRTRTGGKSPAEKALPIDKPEINRESEYAWWFDWEKDEDPLTFWDRRYNNRKNRR